MRRRKVRLRSASFSRRITELERKLAESGETGRDLKREIKGLQQLEKCQGRELQRRVDPREYDEKIKLQDEYVKRMKERAKELERRVGLGAANDGRIQEYIQNLSEKCAQLQASVESLRKRSATALPPPPPNPQTEEFVEKLRTSLRSLKKTLEAERTTTRRTLEGLQKEMDALRGRIKEADQESRLTALRVRELSKVPAIARPVVQTGHREKDKGRGWSVGKPRRVLRAKRDVSVRLEYFMVGVDEGNGEGNGKEAEEHRFV